MKTTKTAHSTAAFQPSTESWNIQGIRNHIRMWIILINLLASLAMARGEWFFNKYTPKGVDFSKGTASFADEVVLYQPVINARDYPLPINRNPTNCLGAPDYWEDNWRWGFNMEDVSLGAGGILIVKFTDNALTGSGDSRPDLYIFESGPQAEGVKVAISRDGITYVDMGPVAGHTHSIDLDAHGFGPNDRFYYVRVQDIVGDGPDTDNRAGADIDSIGAISTIVLPSLRINNVTVKSANLETTNATFTICLVEASDHEVRVNYATKDASARAGVDYDATAGTLIFPAGQTNQMVTVNIRPQGTNTAPCVFLLTLSNPVDARLAIAEGKGTILNPEQVLYPLTITVDNKSRLFGTANPTFTGTIIGLRDNDNIQATYACEATTASPAGRYIIVPSLIDLNHQLIHYTVSTNPGALTVVWVNQAPSFVRGPDETAKADAGPQTFPSWASEIKPGPADEEGQSVSFTVSNNNRGLFAVQPAITPNGILSFTPAGTEGAALVTVVLQDNGGIANGGQDSSAPQSFWITTHKAEEGASFGGIATDALTKEPLTGVIVQLGSDTQTTGPDGRYSFTNVPPGGIKADFVANPTRGTAPLMVQFHPTVVDTAYTLRADKTGYAQYIYTPVELTAGEHKEWNISLSPSFKGFRLVLNWGTRPRDLDAHLLTPPMDGATYHIQYANRYTGQTNHPPFAQLDADATTGYGPETTTIASNTPGVYRYYVHNYQEEQGNTGELIDSEAVVQIYSTAGLIETVRVPRAGQGTFWDVCAIDGTSGKITIINQIVKAAPEAHIGENGSNPGNATQPKFLWNLGDGQTSEGETPDHLYATPSSYPITLQITLPDGRKTIVTKLGYIEVVDDSARQPKLEINRVPSGLLIAWQNTQTGWVLESRPDLRTGEWMTVTAVPTPAPAGWYSLAIETNGPQYFRLRKDR